MIVENNIPTHVLVYCQQDKDHQGCHKLFEISGLHAEIVTTEPGFWDCLSSKKTDIVLLFCPDDVDDVFSIINRLKVAGSEYRDLPVITVFPEETPKELGLRLGRNMFPYLVGNRDLRINRLEILFEAPGADPSAQRVVEFLVGHKIGHTHEDRCECEVQTIYCIASAEWPGLYHGVLDVQLGPLNRGGYHDLGTFRFLSDSGEISHAFLFCGYNVM